MLRFAMLLVLSLYSFQIFAHEPWHMISFGRNGLGWIGSSEKINTHSDSPFKGVDYLLSNVALNYAYKITPRFQLGGFYEGNHSEYKFKNNSGSTSRSEIESNSYGIFFIYNFRDDLNDAFYIGYSFGITNYAEENSHDFETAEGKAPFELDDVTETHELIFGKRFSLKTFKVENLAYSPQVRLFYRTHGKDFDDQDVGNGRGLTLEPIRFDLLF